MLSQYCTSTLFPLLILLLTISISARQLCYFPDGITLDSDGYSCGASSSVTAQCCRTYEACLSGGLCYTQFDAVTYRRSCTDPTFKDPNCPTVCNDVALNGPNSMMQCAIDGATVSNCCLDGATSCCSNTTFTYKYGEIIGILDGNGNNLIAAALGGSSSATPASTNSVSSTGTASVSTTTTTVTSACTSESASNTCNSDASRLVGIAVGIPLGVVVIIAIGATVFLFRRLKKETGRQRGMQEVPTSTPVQPKQDPPKEVPKGTSELQWNDRQRFYEVDDSTREPQKHEMPGTLRRGELESGTVTGASSALHS